MMSILKMASDTRTRMTIRNGQVIRISCVFSPLDGMSISMSLVQTRCWMNCRGQAAGIGWWVICILTALGVYARALASRLHPTKLQGWLKFINQGVNPRKHLKSNPESGTVSDTAHEAVPSRRKAAYSDRT